MIDTDRQPDAAPEVLKVIENALEIPHYAFGDNEAACSMRNALELAAAFVRSSPSAPSRDAAAAPHPISDELRAAMLGRDAAAPGDDARDAARRVLLVDDSLLANAMEAQKIGRDRVTVSVLVSDILNAAMQRTKESGG